jgi:hypothetical protein
MTEIVISVERGSDGQPVGWLRTSSGEVVEFTGWLRLIRALEDELHREPLPGPSLPD